MTTVERLSLEKEGEYQDFLKRNPRVQIYSDISFRNFLGKCVGGESEYFIALDEGKRIVGSLNCFMYEHPKLGVVVNSLPWFGSHGGCVVSSDLGQEARAELLASYLNLVGEENVISATLILSPHEQDSVEEYRKVIRPVAEDLRHGQISHLPTESAQYEDQLYALMHQKTRNLVRKSLKQRFEYVIDDSDEAWEFLHATHVENMSAIGGSPKPKTHFEALRTEIPKERRKLTVAMLGKERVAALLLLMFNQTVEYVTPVIKVEHRSAQPLSFLIWQGMLDACHNGYRYWNWGGTWTSQMSLYRFKSRWGAVDYPYSYLISARERGIKKLSANKSALSELFPYYYAFPYGRLK
jgi:hypothetical protein